MIINELSYQFQNQVLNSELGKSRQTISEALNRAGIRAAARAAADLQAGLKEEPHRMNHVHLYIVEAPDRAVFHSEYNLGEKIEWGELARIFQEKEGTVEYTRHGVNHYAVFTTIYPIEWLILLSIDKDEMFGKRTDYFRNISVIAGMVFGISALVVSIFVRRFVRRLQTTLDCVKQIETGDLQARIDPIETQDEVGRLQAGVNAMNARLQARTIERQKAEQALRESEMRYRMVFENSPRIDLGGRLLRSQNPSRRPEEAGGRRHRDLIQPSSRNCASLRGDCQSRGCEPGDACFARCGNQGGTAGRPDPDLYAGVVRHLQK